MIYRASRNGKIVQWLIFVQLIAWFWLHQRLKSTFFCFSLERPTKRPKCSSVLFPKYVQSDAGTFIQDLINKFMIKASPALPLLFRPWSSMPKIKFSDSLFIYFPIFCFLSSTFYIFYFFTLMIHCKDFLSKIQENIFSKSYPIGKFKI